MLLSWGLSEEGEGMQEMEMGERRMRLRAIRQEAMEAVSTTAGLSKACPKLILLQDCWSDFTCDAKPS